MSATTSSTNTTPVSLLSYNINLLPFGRQHVPSHANKDERMSQFISLVSSSNSNKKNNDSSTTNNNDSSSSSYDILALQEVYGSPFLPSFAVPSLCRQTKMIEQFRTRGYPYHAACEQPSLFSMVSKKTFTDSGLVIISKYPIENVASVAFSPPPPLSTLRKHIQHQSSSSNTNRKKRKTNRSHSSASNTPYNFDFMGSSSSSDDDDDDNEKDVTEMNQKDISASTNFATSTAKSAGQPGCLFAAVRVSSCKDSLLLVFNVHLSLCNRHEYLLLQNEADTVVLSDEMLRDDDDDLLHKNRKASSNTKNNSSTKHHQGKTNNKANKVSTKSLSYSFSSKNMATMLNNSNDQCSDGDFGLTPTQRGQVTELRHFIEGILQQYPKGTPFVICGDFNVDALHHHHQASVGGDSGAARPSRAYLELKSMLSPLVGVSAADLKNSTEDGSASSTRTILSEALFDSLGYHPATRPLSASSQLADSPFASYVGGVNRAKTQVRLNSSFAGGSGNSSLLLSASGPLFGSNKNNSSTSSSSMIRSQEVRHDYIFFSGAAVTSAISLSKKQRCRIERFAMPEGSFPFRFLSDHFALIANFDLKPMMTHNHHQHSMITTSDRPEDEHVNNHQVGSKKPSSSNFTLFLSPTTLSILRSFPSLISSILFPKEVRHQRSGTGIPIGAIEVLLLALMFVSLPFWLMLGSVIFFASACVTFFMIIQKKTPMLSSPSSSSSASSNAASSVDDDQDYLELAKVDDSTIAGTSPVKITENLNDIKKSSSPPPNTQTVAELWRVAVTNAGWLPALGPSLFLTHCYAHGWLDQPSAHEDTTASEVITDFHHSFLTYSEVDRLALSLANGMLALCASLPEISITSTTSNLANTNNSIGSATGGGGASATATPSVSIQTSYRVGVLMQSSPTSILIDLAFLVYGHVRIDDIYELPNTAPLIAVPLVGEAQALRTELDDAGCNVAIVTVSQAKAVLTCHARHLHTVIVVPDEPFYFLQQSSAGFNPNYSSSASSANHHHSTAEQFENLFGEEEEMNKKTKKSTRSSDGENENTNNSTKFSQEVNNPVLAGASNSLAARDVSSIPTSLELLATENSIQLVSIGELLHNGCILTREGHFQHRSSNSASSTENINQNANDNNNNNTSSSSSPAAAPSISSYYSNRIPNEDALATVMLDCRSTEANYVSASSPFNKKKKKRAGARFGEEIEEDNNSSETTTPIYGRLLRLSHKNVSRFISQMSETGVIPRPSWSNRQHHQQQQQTDNTKSNKQLSSSPTPRSSSAPTITNSQSRILFQDVHNSYFERWSALSSLLNGHIAIVTRSNVNSLNPTAGNNNLSSSSSSSANVSETQDVNSTLSSRSFHGSCIALKPNIAFTSLLPLIASRELYDKIVSAGFSRHGLAQNFWSFVFRNMVRFRDQLNERDLDSAFVYKMFFKWIATTFFGTRIQRVVVASDEAVPYRVRHFLQLLIPSMMLSTSSSTTATNLPNSHHPFLTVSFSPNVGIVHVNGTPPPRTLIRIIEREEHHQAAVVTSENEKDSSFSTLAGEIDLSGPTVLGIDKDSGGFASSGLIGEWHQRQIKYHQENNKSASSSSSYTWRLQVLCTGDALVRPGSIRSLHDIIDENTSKLSSSHHHQHHHHHHKKDMIHDFGEDDAMEIRSFFASVKENIQHRHQQQSHDGSTSSASPSPSSMPYVSAVALERAYIHECSFIINDMFVWSHDGFPLVAVVVPNHHMLMQLLTARVSQLRRKILNKKRLQDEEEKDKNGEIIDDDDPEVFSSSNQVDDELLRIENESLLARTIHSDVSILFRSEIAKEIVVRACQVAFLNAGLSHEILAVHLHPHSFSAHKDFSRANGSRRRSRMVEYFLDKIEQLYAVAIRQIQKEKQEALSVSHPDHGDDDDQQHSATNSEPGNDSFGGRSNSLTESLLDTTSLNQSGTMSRQASLNIIPPSPSSHLRQTDFGHHNHQSCEEKPKIRPVAPFAVDIGGTCAKVVFFLPTDADTRGLIPSYCTVEKNDPATAALGAAIDESAIQEMMNQSAVLRYSNQRTSNSTPHSNTSSVLSKRKSLLNVAGSSVTALSHPPSSGTKQSGRHVSFRLVCMKLSTSMMSRFIQHLAAAPILPTSTAAAEHYHQSRKSGTGSSSLTSIPKSPNNARASPQTQHLREVSSHSNSTSDTTTTTASQQQHLMMRSPTNSKPSSPTAALFPFIPPSLATSSNASSKLAFMFTRESLQRVPATGGGAFRFQGAARTQLGMGLEPVKEMESLVRGLNILLERCPDLAVFSYDTRTHTPARHKLTMMVNPRDATTALHSPAGTATNASVRSADGSVKTATNDQDEEQLKNTASASATTPRPNVNNATETQQSSPYPFLLVNVGSGVSIVKLGAGDGSFVRVGGSPVGGATFWGLARALTNINSWEDLREITRVDGPGDHTKVDLLVGDIYGYNATQLPAGLTVDTLASSCGKLATSSSSNSNNNNNSVNHKNTNMIRNSSSGESNNNNMMNAVRNNSGSGVENLLLSDGENGKKNSMKNSRHFDEDDTTELLDWTQEVIQMASPKNVMKPDDDKNQRDDEDDEDDDGTKRQNSTNNDLENDNDNKIERMSLSSNNNNRMQQNPSPATLQNQNQNNNNHHQHHQHQPNELSSVDIIRSLLMMVATNITQIAFLYAKQENVRNILFTGGFVRGNALVWNQMTRALHYWSAGQMTAHFLKNDGYVGVLGALLNDQRQFSPSAERNRNDDNNDEQENGKKENNDDEIKSK